MFAVFDVLNIDKLAYSDGALREGVMYDLLGRFKHEDIRDRSVQALMGRYNADTKQAERVVNTAQQLFDHVVVVWIYSVKTVTYCVALPIYTKLVWPSVMVDTIAMVHIYCNILIFPAFHKLTKTICRIWLHIIAVNCAVMLKPMF